MASIVIGEKRRNRGQGRNRGQALYAFKRASGLARRVFPVWAAQGPFETGEESAAAMRYAYLAVFGQEEAERMGMAEAISKHAFAYDSNPVAWEQNRQQTMQSANSETEEFVTIAKGLAAMDSLNKDFLESGGHKCQHRHENVIG